MLIVAYNGGDDLVECLRSIHAHPPSPHLRVRIIVVDNGSSDGSAERIRTEFPAVVVITPGTNTGFAGGNNVGLDYVRCHFPGTKYLYLLNQDTLVSGTWVDPLVDRLETDAGAGAVQPLILLYPEIELINTAGNRCHFLGFTFITRYRERVTPFEPERVADAVSGAAVLIRLEALEGEALFDSRMFMYYEDVDLSWRLRLKGYTLFLVPDSRVFHRYTFRSPTSSYFYLERNRWWLLLRNYRWRTLVIMAPAIFAMEIGQVVYAIGAGQLRQKFASVCAAVRPDALRSIANHRRNYRKARTLRASSLWRESTGSIDDRLIRSKIVTLVANPFFRFYLGVLRMFTPRGW